MQGYSLIFEMDGDTVLCLHASFLPNLTDSWGLPVNKFLLTSYTNKSLNFSIGLKCNPITNQILLFDWFSQHISYASSLLDSLPLNHTKFLSFS